MGSQHRISLTGGGGGFSEPHYSKTQVKSLESAVEKAPNEAGAKIALQVFVSIASGQVPIVATIVTLYQVLLLIQKIEHYAKIAEEKGTDAAIVEFLKDTAKDQINNYITDKVTRGLVDSSNIDPKYRGIVGKAVNAVVEQGVDGIEERT